MAVGRVTIIAGGAGGGGGGGVGLDLTQMIGLMIIIAIGMSFSRFLNSGQQQ
ncbi:MAG: hypothetical protein QXF17_01360 [Ignisphaera sp.]